MTQHSFKTFADAFTAPQPPVAANDNRPKPKRKAQPRYRGTLPALNWLFKRDPVLAEAVAKAVEALRPSTNWTVNVDEKIFDIRPSEDELVEAASNAFRPYVRDGKRHEAKGLKIYNDGQGREWVDLGDLRFLNGKLQYWGVTKKGTRLKPSEQYREREKSTPRNPKLYLKTKPTTPSPLHAEPLQRPFSGEPALPPMLDELDGVAEAKRVLAEAYTRSPDAPVQRYPTVVAKGAIFLGGVTNSNGTASSGYVGPCDAPEPPKGEVMAVIEEVAAGGTLQSIGESFGYEGDYAARIGKGRLLEAAMILAAANDNQLKKKVAA